MREDLIRLLHDGNYSCVVSKDGEIRTFTRRGVVDLFELYRSDPDFMRGAKVADKVIGKGAAAMLALGGVSEVWTDVISEPACELLEKCGVELSYDEKCSLHHQPHPYRALSAGNRLRRVGQSGSALSCHLRFREEDAGKAFGWIMVFAAEFCRENFVRIQ